VIIQSLVSLYERLEQNPEIQLPSAGFAVQKVSFALVLNHQGKLVQIKDLRNMEDGKIRPMIMTLPSIERSGSGLSPQFMWDNTQYVLGDVLYDEEKKKESEKKQQRARSAFQEFKKFHKDVFSASENKDILAVLKFLDQWNPDDAKSLENWQDMADTNLVFMIEGKREFVHDVKEVKHVWIGVLSKKENPEEGFCLLTGKKSSLARLHPMIKNVNGSQAKGAAIVSFNKNAFCSYEKEQSYNAPINTDSVFKYTTVLNYLLRRDSGNRQRINIGDATTVFWTEKDSKIESFLGMVLDPRDDAGDSEEIRAFLDAVRKGVRPDNIQEEAKFYILGLSPNNSRLAVRFWHACSVGQLMNRLHKHFHALEMERQWDSDPLNPGIWHLLKETARESKDISPVLGGALMRAILEGGNYPMNLFNGVINRIRADHRINYLRAASCKAVLTRNYHMEVPMSLDTENKDVAYLLGRLFAVLEKAQQDAIPGANATIKDRFYGSASATPASVFPRLLRLAAHHISKAEYGHVSDRRIAEIMESFESFPDHMDLKQQGLFTIGYYHQRNDLFKKKEKNEQAA